MILAARIRKALDHRPWTLDLVVGLVSLAYGLFMALEPNTDAKAYSFLAWFSDFDVGIATATLGFVQISVALPDFRVARQIVAFFGAWHWTSFAFGMVTSDWHARGWILVAGYAGANLAILLRV